MSLSNTYCLHMIYAGFKRVGTWWNYKHIISPFYRLYYIEKGCGRVYINHTPYELTPGTLFLIPKFTLHSYECSNFMEHYYICFFDDSMYSSGIPFPSLLKLKATASAIDVALFKRYLALNPHKQLTVSNPLHYDNDRHIYTSSKDIHPHPAIQMESSGILLQLFSHFISEECTGKTTSHHLHKQFETVVQYINQHISTRIYIPILADIVCLSPDHFSKVFKKIMGISPCEYIQMKRIERAQALLLTTDMSIKQIAEHVGIINPSQFTRLFTKIAQCPPKEYKEKTLSV